MCRHAAYKCTLTMWYQPVAVLLLYWSATFLALNATEVCTNLNTGSVVSAHNSSPGSGRARRCKLTGSSVADALEMLCTSSGIATTPPSFHGGVLAAALLAALQAAFTRPPWTPTPAQPTLTSLPVAG